MSGAGQIDVFDVPVPLRLRDSVLVRNAYSLISSGTEGAAVTRRAGLLGLYEKAMGSKDRIHQAWQLAQDQGYARAMEIIRHKLADHTPMGYSCAGEVVEVDHAHMPYRVGDHVACMGAGLANHAEYVAVPRNLVARIPDGVPMSAASFAALGCIAIQGIRRLELTPGEWVGVIGLGLVGQICVRALAAMGYSVVGTDLSAERARVASNVPGVDAWASPDTDSVARVLDRTAGRGLDGVVVCAATESHAPVNLAFDLCRVRGRVSVVGDVGLGLDRSRMYAKELELRLSCSYGPGRYDNQYEIQGHDYPYGYVRWTEGRNLAYFLDLLARGAVDVGPLITATYPVSEAREAYLRVKSGDASTYGVLFDYGAATSGPETTAPRRIEFPRASVPGATGTASADPPLRIGLIGVGGFAKAVHIPNLRRLPGLFRIRAVASRSGGTAGVVARKIGAEMATSDYSDVLADRAIDAVIISTRHASHGRIIIDALEAGKHVFVEKPMTTTVEDGQAVLAAAERAGRIVRVGFNRRFSPYLRAMRQAVGTLGPCMISVRVNVGAVGGHWSNTAEEGGRFLGEGVHFFDLCNWFVGEEPEAVCAMFCGDNEVTNPNGEVLVRYPDGSTAHITYTALGHAGMGKEYIEVFRNGRAAVCDDFRTLRCFGGRAAAGRGARGDKGQLEELKEFAAAVRGRPHPVAGADARAGLVATWLAVSSYQSARTRAWIIRDV